jgi:hypothetical protein
VASRFADSLDLFCTLPHRCSVKPLLGQTIGQAAKLRCRKMLAMRLISQFLFPSRLSCSKEFYSKAT